MASGISLDSRTIVSHTVYWCAHLVEFYGWCYWKNDVEYFIYLGLYHKHMYSSNLCDCGAKRAARNLVAVVVILHRQGMLCTNLPS